MKPISIIFSCEHASNTIPEDYLHLFKNKKKLLLTHRGYDQGTKKLSSDLAKHFKSPVVQGNYSRLLVDLNRSKKNKTAFSEITKPLSKNKKNEIITLYHQPHWDKIKTIIAKKIDEGFLVIHIGVHSFTPILYNEIRNAEIGILYHSRKKTEAKFAKLWQNYFHEHCELRIRRNYPYDGKMDGLSSSMRKLFSEKDYLGFEIEVNHSILRNLTEEKFVAKLLKSTLKEALTNFRL
ncbi:MAG: N-formylglutamate amidohydrolase [Bdellovibrionales bacterium]|nr:N-formylglutamate amidohydrolase [Bdellovibrionales bacterium]